MHLTIDKNTLSKGLQTVSRVVASRNTIPILSNVVLSAEGTNLSLVATDLDIEISLSIPANVIVPGETSLNAKLLTEIARKMPTDEVAIKVEDGNATASSGQSKFNLQTLPASDMPSLSVGELTHNFEMKAADFRKMLKRCAFAISTEETRYYLNGVFLHSTSDEFGSLKLRAVATDGHRLAKTEIDAPEGSGGMPGIIVPRKTVAEVDRILDIDANVEIGVSESKIRFIAGNAVLTSKIIDGSFPDYTRVIPAPSNQKATAQKASFGACVDRVSTISSTRGRAVRMTFSEGGCLMYVSSPDHGEAQEEIALDYGGEAITIGFNAQYVGDILSNCETDQVEFFLTDAGSPARIHPVGDSSTTYVLMPMRV